MARTKELDMLNGALLPKLMMFSLPLALTGILQLLFNAADVIVVGKFAGSTSLAAVGATSALINLLTGAFIGISVGVNILVARYLGCREYDRVRTCVHTVFALSFVLGLIVMVAGLTLSTPLLELMKTPEDVLPLSSLYLRIYFIGVPGTVMYNFGAALLRAFGDTKRPMVFLTVSGVVNVALNLFFVAVLGMTVNGVAIATVISNALSSAILYFRLRTTAREVHVEPHLLRIDLGILKRILRIGLPAGIQSGVFSLANIIIQSAINSLGTVVMAASSAAFNIEIFTYDIVNAFGQACTTFVGQNFGAGELKRCKKTLLLCLAEGAAILLAAIALIISFGKPLLSIFNSDPEVIDIGYIRVMLVVSAHFFSMLYEVMSGYLRGFGISLGPAILTMIGVCVVRLLWIQFVFPLSRTFRTIMLVYPVSLSLTALMIFVSLLCTRPSRRFAKKVDA